MSEWIAIRDREPSWDAHVILCGPGPRSMYITRWSGKCLDSTHWQPAPDPLKIDSFEEYFASLPLWEGEGGCEKVRRVNGRCMDRSDLREPFNAGFEAGRKEKL